MQIVYETWIHSLAHSGDGILSAAGVLSFRKVRNRYYKQFHFQIVVKITGKQINELTTHGASES